MAAYSAREGLELMLSTLEYQVLHTGLRIRVFRGSDPGQSNPDRHPTLLYSDNISIILIFILKVIS